MLRPMLLRVHYLSWTEPDHCEPHARKELQSEKQKYVTFLGRRRSKTTLWRSAGSVYALGAPRSHCSAFALLPMKMVTLWKMKTSRAGGYVNIGDKIFEARIEGERHHSPRSFSDAFRRLLTIYGGKVIPMNLMNSSLQVCWRVGFYTFIQGSSTFSSRAPFLHSLLLAGLSSFPYLPTSTTMVSL